MYHERQQLMYCAMHALNNLFQEPWVDRKLMECLALKLFNREAALREESGMGKMRRNPFKSVIPRVGDYDVSVLLEALKLRKHHVSLHVLFNPKKPDAFAESLTEAVDAVSVKGIIVNFVSSTFLWGAWVNHHFYTITKIVEKPRAASDSVNVAATEAIAGRSAGGEQSREGIAATTSAPGSPRSPTTRRKRHKRRSPRAARSKTGFIRTVALSRSCSPSREATRIQDSSNASGSGNNTDTGNQSDVDADCLRPARRRCPLVDHYPNRDGSDSDGGGASVLASPIGQQGGGGGKGGGEGKTISGDYVWYSLDSMLRAPKRIGSKAQLLEHLLREAREHNGHVFIVSQEESQGRDDDAARA